MIALNLIHFSPYEFGLDLFGLISFAIGSCIVISILGFYYNRIPKSNNSKTELNTPFINQKTFYCNQILMIII
jgi:hypothetical protein